MDQSLESALGRQNRRFLIFGAFIILISLPVGILFLGNAVEVKVEPKEAADNFVIEVVNGWALPYLEKKLVLSNGVDFELSSPGFEITVARYDKDADGLELIVEMKSLPGTVELAVDTPHQFVLRVPELNIESREPRSVFTMARGLYVLELEGPQLEPLTQEIFVEGRGTPQSFIIKPERIGAQLSFEVAPKAAKVEMLRETIEGQNGECRIRLPAGRHELRVSADGYEDFVKQISVARSEAISLGLLSLVPSLIRFDLRTSPSNAAVLLDGEFVGETPLNIKIKPLHHYEVTLKRAGYAAIKKSIDAEVGQNIVKNYDLEQNLHTISLSSSPVATVSLNGSPVGVTPSEIRVSEGDRLVLRSEGYAEEGFTVAASHLDEKKNHIVLIKKERKAFVDAPEQKTIAGVKLRRLEGADNFSTAMQGVSSGTFKIPDLYVSETEVTVGAYSSFLGQKGKSLDASHPITGVRWEDAVRFCNWLSQKEGLQPFYRFDSVDGIEIGSTDSKGAGYRLPTLVEWLFLVTDGKGLDDAPYVGGMDPKRLPRGIGNLAGRERAAERGFYFQDYKDEYLEMAPVKSFRPSGFGVFDLVGNAREWLHNTAGPSDNYFGSGMGMEHLVVGSSYMSGKAADLKSAEISKELFSAEDIGFRVVRVIR